MPARRKQWRLVVAACCSCEASEHPEGGALHVCFVVFVLQFVVVPSVRGSAAISLSQRTHRLNATHRNTACTERSTSLYITDNQTRAHLPETTPDILLHTPRRLPMPHSAPSAIYPSYARELFFRGSRDERAGGAGCQTRMVPKELRRVEMIWLTPLLVRRATGPDFLRKGFDRLGGELIRSCSYSSLHELVAVAENFA